MKPVDLKKMEQLPGIRLENGSRFNFHCHGKLACFNRCCRNLNLFLYPYDVIRLKNALKVTADEFIAQYVDVVMREFNFFPDVLLRMAENEEKTCPFMTDAGCSVYSHRPDTCRSFPVDCGALYNGRTGNTRLVHFFRPPDFCLGQYEQRTWTIETWTRDQEAHHHVRMTTRWAEIKRLFQSDPWGAEGPDGRKAKMAFMATYNMDRFREFVFGSTFLLRYKVKSKYLKRMEADDAALLAFGFDWVKFFIWGMKSKRFSPKS